MNDRRRAVLIASQKFNAVDKDGRGNNNYV